MKGIISQRIAMNISNLSKVEQQVAQLVLDQGSALMQLSTQEIAKESQTSPASVVRFCKSMGLKGVPELKLALSAEGAQAKMTGYFDIVADEPAAILIEKLKANTMQTVEDTLALIDVAQLQAIATALTQAETVFVYGIGASWLVAEDFMQKWLRMGKHVHAVQDIHLMATMMATAQTPALFLGVSYSGETPEVIKLRDRAIEKGITTVSLTGFGSNTLNRASDYVLQTSHAPEAFLRSAATSSRTAQLFIIDALFYVYAAMDVQHTQAALQETRAAIKALK
ncbi:MurR/RpiR family transcriptional regulator [Brochothrix campestris]|uniref:RpiR family phosphosugar-binding transcriptional regulator n=1 Tax=Brochothrix campestris FSL F6-1037 TaxID=1265861 RepID=W7CXU7_9LIST|nr:MurR/RpiR family transcriptional regulator [Brochothrix campestris]EUJ41590.1 RpiR family phosphosugar-binding transcriptional regulator [Brochothrix campestris FSL F6-1037]